MAKPDDAPVTWGELRKVYKRLDARIGEAFEAIASGDDRQAEFWDEHEDKINRLTRGQNRMSKRIRELEEE